MHTLCHAVTLTINLSTLNFYSTSGVTFYTVHEIWATSNNWQLSYWRFSTFSPCNFRGWDSFTEWFSGVRGLNFTKHGEDIGRSSQHCTFVSELDILLHFQTRAASVSDVDNDAKFRTFWLPVKISGRMGEISNRLSIVENLPTTKPPEYICGHPRLSTVDS